jgi:hypothetical protein
VSTRRPAVHYTVIPPEQVRPDDLIVVPCRNADSVLSGWTTTPCGTHRWRRAYTTGENVSLWPKNAVVLRRDP